MTVIQIRIMRFKQDAKRNYGPKSEWPDWVRARYDEMKLEATERQPA
jgi:hypothetical protein